MKKNQQQYYHLVGIKGAGMAGLAKILKNEGVKITGSDVKEKFFTDRFLVKLNIPIFQGFSEINIGRPNLVIASAAWNEENNPEIREAKRKKIKIIFYPEALGRLMKGKYGIAVAGSHGKTTTTAIAGLILEKANLDPTVILGTSLKEFSGNARFGKSPYFIAEACEYREHFLLLNPKIIVITNIDYDHSDYFKTKEDYKKAFLKFVQKLKKKNSLIGLGDDKIIRQIAQSTKAKTIFYGFSPKNDIYAHDIKKSPLKCEFEVTAFKKPLGRFSLKIPGDHNILNGLAALTLALVMKIDIEVVKKVFENFKGSKRRLEFIGKKNDISIYDDYAHHPKEIRATLSALRQIHPCGRIWAIFQPHTYSRTYALRFDFAKSFKEADFVILDNIFSSAREEKGNISSKKLAQLTAKYHKNVWYKNKEEIIEFLKKRIKKRDVIITLGAGDIYKLGKNFFQYFK